MAQDTAEKLYPSADRGISDIPTTEIKLHRLALQARSDPQQATQQAARFIDGLPPTHRGARVMAAAHIVLDAVPEPAHALPAVRELRALTTA